MSNSYLDAVRLGRNAWWRYLLSFLLISFFWLVLGSMPFLVWMLWHSGDRTVAKTLNENFIPATSDDQILQYLLLSLSFCFFLLGIFLAVTGIHQRRFRSLIRANAQVQGGRIIQGASVWLLFAAIPYGIEALIDLSHFSLTFKPVVWLVFLPLALVFTPIQATAEELFFRGYLLQSLSLLTRHRWILIGLSSVIFGALHLPNPEVAASDHSIWIALNYVGFGVLMALVTLKDHALELAIGSHVANNLFLALLIRDQVSVLNTPAIITRVVTPNAQIEFFIFVFQAIAFYLVFFRRRRTAASAPEV